MYSASKPRPKAGYQCKICGKEGGQPDSHWFQLCPYKDQKSEATTYIPPKKGYFCKYCLKPGGEKDSHWFQQCPHYKKIYHGRGQGQNSARRHPQTMGGISPVHQPYSNGFYHAGVPIAPHASNYYEYQPHPNVAANGMILHYPQYSMMSGATGQMYYMQHANVATTEQIYPEGADPSANMYEYQMYSPQFVPQTYPYPAQLGRNKATESEQKQKDTEEQDAKENKEEKTQATDPTQTELVKTVKSLDKLDLADTKPEKGEGEQMHAIQDEAKETTTGNR